MAVHRQRQAAGQALGLAVLLGLSVPVLAQGTAAPVSPRATERSAPIAMPRGIVPNKSELPKSAFDKLDADRKGYVSREDVVQLDGFGSAFAQSDWNDDGRLDAAEFDSAWSIYTGQRP